MKASSAIDLRTLKRTLLRGYYLMGCQIESMRFLHGPNVVRQSRGHAGNSITPPRASCCNP
jgi:hypothetical protein